MIGLVRIIAWLMALAVVTFPLVAVLNGWLAPDRWPIRHLQVTAEYQRVSVEQIRTTVLAHMGRGYFDTDPGTLRSALAGIPWVDRVEVRKRWPDRLDVVLVEHRARARWGEGRLLSEEGVLFTTPGTAELQGLPQLYGPDDRAVDVLAFYERAQQQLVPTGLVLESARLSTRGSWSLRLHGGASIMVGRSTAPEARIARLVRVLPQLLEGERRPFRQIDLRYTNGFAIAWGEPDAGGDAAANAEAMQALHSHSASPGFSAPFPARRDGISPFSHPPFSITGFLT